MNKTRKTLAAVAATIALATSFVTANATADAANVKQVTKDRSWCC